MAYSYLVYSIAVSGSAIYVMLAKHTHSSIKRCKNKNHMYMQYFSLFLINLPLENSLEVSYNRLLDLVRKYDKGLHDQMTP